MILDDINLSIREHFRINRQKIYSEGSWLVSENNWSKASQTWFWHQRILLVDLRKLAEQSLHFTDTDIYVNIWKNHTEIINHAKQLLILNN